MKVRQIMQAFVAEESGVTSAECAMFLAVVVVVVVAATALLGGRLDALTSNVAGGISNTATGTGGGPAGSAPRWAWMKGV